MVLHLHGSLCIYIKEFEIDNGLIKIINNPIFKFDPDSIGNIFHPYEKAQLDASYSPNIEERVIAPVPDKTEGLKNNFIRQIYSEAKKLLSSSEVLIVIGYNFSVHDRSSYQPLIDHVSNNWSGKIVIVSPNAEDIARRLRSDYPSIKWDSVNATFKGWVDAGYPGMN